MRIPLPKMMRHYRAKEFTENKTTSQVRAGVGLWSYFAKRPWLYRQSTKLGAALLHALGGKRGRIAMLPLASGWTSVRDLPAPAGRTFQQLYKMGGHGKKGDAR